MLTIWNYTAECTDELVYDDASATDNCGSIEIVLVEEIVAGDCPQGTQAGPSLRQTTLAMRPR